MCWYQRTLYRLRFCAENHGTVAALKLYSMRVATGSWTAPTRLCWDSEYIRVYLISSIDLVSSKSEPMSWEGLRGDFFVSSKRYMMFYLEELGPNSIQWDAIEERDISEEASIRSRTTSPQDASVADVLENINRNLMNDPNSRSIKYRVGLNASSSRSMHAIPRA